ncbi:MAG: DUF4982 domain-containing protein [Bacteroidaceae bacterium]|nr:DUF4982 domain-containing protein [Bacteroidaceae bacterium]
MRHIYAAALVTLLTLSAYAQRTETYFKTGWRFSRTDEPAQSATDFDDSGWERVRVPHDWAIYGPFSKNNDKQITAIAQDGQTEASEHSGRTGGLPFVGAGWYRLKFEAPDFDEGKRATLVFDGAMSHARVYINGKEAGGWIYGYNSFEVDATPYLKAGKENTLAVRLENETESSRWYPGAGLYRNVHLVVCDGRASIKTWGTWVSTREVSKDGKAGIDVQQELHVDESILRNDENNERAVMVKCEILDAEGNLVAQSMTRATKTDQYMTKSSMVVPDAHLWSPESPYLYTCRSRVYSGKEVVDETSTRFGIRTIEVRPDEGFFLNGKPLKFKGTCNHHDLGPLGAAVNESAIRRQIRILQEMGCNAYRTSHNMPAPELIKICDEMGMLVMCESFDEWRQAKVANGYHKVFFEQVENDVRNLVRQFRSSPSIVMWCIGNEVPDQGCEDGCRIARLVQDLFHKYDHTRPCTQGMDNPGAVIYNNFAAVMDVPGFNYRPWRYKEAYQKLPQQVLVGSETASTISSRGVYKFPVQRTSMAKYDDHQACSYDLGHCSWSDLPEDNFMMYEDLPYDMGEFVWTGFDYLGEPTPYYSDWPNHSSLFGIIDMAGIPKDRYYLYRSVWKPNSETLHILPHWTWNGRKGEVTPVFVYSNYPTVELFINGKSQGRRTKDLTVKIDGSDNDEAKSKCTRQKRYRHMWMNTKYEEGNLRAVAYDSNGNQVAEAEISTAGKPYAIRLVREETLEAYGNKANVMKMMNAPALKAGTEDLAFVRVQIVDQKGNLCPDADVLVKFKVKGAGDYRAGANGDPTCLEQFHLPQMHVFKGQMTAIVEENGNRGTIELTATAPGLKPATLTIEVK